MSLFRILPLSLLLLALNFSGTKPFVPEEKSTGLTAFVPVNSKEEDDDFIPWVKDRRLNWDDFLSNPKRGTEAIASTSTSLGISYRVENGIFMYNITCNFAKHKSWGLVKTGYILAHEQGHFDITEIYARKLYKALQEYQFNEPTYKHDVNEIYHSIVKEKEAMQASYDGQSDHSRDRRQQYLWEDRIQKMLEETEIYSSYP